MTIKALLVLALIIAVVLAWFRSGIRWGPTARGNLVALIMFALLIAGILGLILLVGRLF